MEVIRYTSRPKLDHPVMISAFHGWNDAADASTMALAYLEKQWDTTEFATVDPEEFYDFQAHRPQIGFAEDGSRNVKWPTTRFGWASVPGADRHAVLLEATEPSMRWRTYTDSVVELARETGVELLVTLGALIAHRPHTRPIKVTGTSYDSELADRLGLVRSTYEGPTGVVGVLNESCKRAGIPAVSLWAWIPPYLTNSPSPPGALELVKRLQRLLSFDIGLEDLESATTAYNEQVAKAIEADPEVAEEVRDLERRSDEQDMSELPTGDEIAAELQKYLRDMRDDDGP